MRKPRRTVSAVADFPCSAAAVWQMFTREQGYKEWFGFPVREDLVFVDPGFSVGGKLSFKGRHTMIITSLLPERELVFSDASYRFTFLLDPIPEGVSVNITMDSYAAGRYEEYDAARFCSETLRALKRAVGAVISAPVIEPRQEDFSSFVPPFEFARRMFAGYRRPVTSRSATEANEVYSSIIDNTDASVTIVRRALMFALLLALFFFTAIGISLSFQRSDIVPSSGLSLFESENVNKYVSTLIRVGDLKPNLERRLSCQGERAFRFDGTLVYNYASLEKYNEDMPREQIYVVYDAYGKARSIAYVDAAQSDRDLFREPSNFKLKEGIQYYELDDKNILLSPSMNLYEVEEIIGVDVSAYTVVRNLDVTITTLYFGRFIYDDLFTTNFKSQIVVVLNEAAGVTSVTYYNPIGHDDPLPLAELSKPLRRQYAGLEEYLFDRFAFERMFLLLDLSPTQAEILLSAKGLLKNAASEPSLTEETAAEAPASEEEPEELEQVLPEPLVEVYRYAVRSPAEQVRSYYRYLYDIDFEESLSRTVRFKNQKLALYTGDTLSHVNKDSFLTGMRYNDVVTLVGILPSAAECDANRFILHYGREEASGEEGPVYPLSLTFTMSTFRLMDIDFHETPQEVSEDATAQTD